MGEKLNKVVVFFGGKSVEREVSVITGCQVISKINPLLNKIYPVYINENGEFFYNENLQDIKSFKNLGDIKLKKVCLLPNCKTLFWNKRGKLKKIDDIDVSINCCHGTGGEDGSLAGLLNIAGIPSISPGVLAGAVSMDKVASKIFFNGLHIKQIDYLTFSKTDFILNEQKLIDKVGSFGFPVVVKPCSLGSSVGVKFCRDAVDLKEALEVAFEFDSEVIIERGLENFDEFFCSAFSLNGEIKVSEIEKSGTKALLDFDEKYLVNKKRDFPAKINKALKTQIQTLTKTAYKSLKCSGIIRVDFLFDKATKTLFVNEANVVPGSLALGFWADRETLTDLIEKLMNQAKAKFTSNQKLQVNYSSNILENFESASKNKLK